MFKVLLVDDEPWALLGLVNAFDWTGSGYEIVFQTDNPVKALDAIKRLKPDVVVTDICMNPLDGIALIENVRKDGLDTEFVIVSGYDYFEYAKEAIRHGAFHYLLKPLDLLEVNNVFLKLADHLKKKKKQLEMIENLVFLENFPHNADFIARYLRDNGMEQKYNYYQAVVSHADGQYDHSLLDFPDKTVHLSVNLGGNKFVYLINSDSDIKNWALSAWSERGGLKDVNIGISTVCSSIDKIGLKYREADIAACSCFVSGEPGISFYMKKSVSDINVFVNRIMSVIKSQDGNSVKKLFNDIKTTFAENRYGIEEVTFFYNQFVSHISYKYSDTLLRTDLEFQTYEQLFRRFMDFNDVLEYLAYILDEINEQTPKLESVTNETFMKLIKYVEANYNKTLFLNDLSRKFNINTTYICDLFKKHMGLTFTEYLTQLRLNKAAEMLAETDYSIVQIADEVGYGDYCYFSKVFKEHFKMTPSGYRKQNRI